MTADEPSFDPDVLAQLADALLVISSVGYGDYAVTVDVQLPERHPLTPLLHGINDMIRWLARENDERERYLHALQAAQRAALWKLSTPMIEVREGVLCVPVIGDVDRERGARMTEALLKHVQRHQVREVILDLTGVDALDGQAIAELIRMLHGVRLLGAVCALSGLGPTLARNLVDMGVQLPASQVYRTLSEALAG